MAINSTRNLGPGELENETARRENRHKASQVFSSSPGFLPYPHFIFKIMGYNKPLHLTQTIHKGICEIRKKLKILIPNKLKICRLFY